MTRVLAVDLGATSVRVAEVVFPDAVEAPWTLTVLHRHRHRPRTFRDGTLRWDWDEVLSHVEEGLSKGLARDHLGPVASIGVDTWGVDYGLLANGMLLSPPVSYRDPRTRNWNETLDRLGRERLFERTAIQLMPINTVFQLACHSRDELAAADQLLMLPELAVAHLTGAQVGEISSAGTTGLLECSTGDWATSLLDELGLPLRPIALPRFSGWGARAGAWRGVPVHLVSGHDTASAIMTVTGSPGDVAFVSSGSWLLVGTERAAPDNSPAARDASFSSEPTGYGSYGFLTNLPGFMLLERLLEHWGEPPNSNVLKAAEAVPADVAECDVREFENLAGAELEAALGKHYRGVVDRPALVTVLLTSMATAVASTVQTVGDLTGRRMGEIEILGGGTRIPLFADLLASRVDVRVRTGSPEATALGNAIAQGIAVGRWADVAAARADLATARLASNA